MWDFADCRLVLEEALRIARDRFGLLEGPLAGQHFGPKSPAALIIPVEIARRATIRIADLIASAVGDGFMFDE
jgi:hypothetical protein